MSCCKSLKQWLNNMPADNFKINIDVYFSDELIRIGNFEYINHSFRDSDDICSKFLNYQVKSISIIASYQMNICLYAGCHSKNEIIEIIHPTYAYLEDVNPGQWFTLVQPANESFKDCIFVKTNMIPEFMFSGQIACISILDCSNESKVLMGKAVYFDRTTMISKVDMEESKIKEIIAQ